MKEFVLLVVTTDRFHLVERLFKSLKRQEYKSFSVILAYDREAQNEARRVEEKFAGQFPVKWMALEKCGVSKARNQALRYASGDYIAFPDDDCEYFPDTLAAARHIFEARPEAAGILGRRTNEKKARAQERAFGPAVSRYNVFSGSETFLQFYRRECLERIGDFDEELGWGTGLPYGSGEDTDFAIRALRAGCEIVRAQNVRVRHPEVNLGDPGLMEKTALYAAGRMKLLRKFNYPLWFKIANITLPLAFLPRDVMRHGWQAVKWRLRMFRERLRNYFEPEKKP